MRLDVFLTQQYPEISRSYAGKLIDSGLVTVDGKVAKSSLQVTESNEVCIAFPEPVDATARAEEIDLEILYEDDDLLLVNKPKGMVVHPAFGHASGTLVNAVLNHCKGRLSDINGVIRPGIVHRIDKDTSGVLLVTKTNFAHEYFSERFKTHDIERVYLAIVEGVIVENRGKIDAPIGRHPTDRKKMAVNIKDGKRAVTHFEVLERLNGYTLLRVTLETGRTHQIRVHLSYIGHPIVGDPVYGKRKSIHTDDGQLLHAAVLGFRHPVSNEYLKFETKPPKSFFDVIDKIKAL